MSVRFKGQVQRRTLKAPDHNSLLNKGTRSHQEIDEHLAELEEARSTTLIFPNV